MWKDKKEYLGEENCQDNLQQRNYSGDQTSSIIKNTGEGWRETWDNGKKDK